MILILFFIRPISGSHRTASIIIGYWHDNVVCLSVRLFVTSYIVAIRYIYQDPTAKVSEHMNMKCPPRNTILQLSTAIGPTLFHQTHTPQNFHVWNSHAQKRMRRVSCTGLLFNQQLPVYYSGQLSLAIPP